MGARREGARPLPPARYGDKVTSPRQRWTYLGPAGTFTEQAALDLAARHGEPRPELIPATSVTAALAEVRAGTADAACVPLENSVEGAVALTQDELTHGEPLWISAEAYVPVEFQLLVREGMTTSAVTTVGSHPHGLAQVRDWLHQHLPDARTVVTDSTAAAAEAVAAGKLDAAAAAGVAGQRYGLTALASNIGLVQDAVTRFVLMRRPEPAAPRTGNDRTSVVLWVQNAPGTLLSLLTEFSARGINLTRLESRPTRAHLGEYVFLVDADGHVTDPAIADVLAAFAERGALLRYLGSYPRAMGESVQPTGSSEQGPLSASGRAARAGSAAVRDRVAGLAYGQLLPDGMIQ